ncbi:MAG TPA: PilN domain-containing protein [Pyrinomonadaceae bacterium]|jgi:Tfp pilus assembly protein PilN|nr:PilN domain-containing protein [Pyrinomonadaceae bacterium]
MIKINLLESVTDRSGGVAIVEEKVANPRTQTMVLALVAAALLVLGIGYDYVSTKAEHAAAQKELERQQQIASQMDAINKEQAEIEKKTKDIQIRIDAIQKLRASQQGPGSVLKSLKERIDSVPGLYLESVENKNGDLMIKGGSPNEASVTRFGQSLEFSSGLFSNLSIETERKVLDKGVVSDDPSEPKPEIVNFTIKCKYTPAGAAKPQPAAAGPAAPANQIAQK